MQLTIPQTAEEKARAIKMMVIGAQLCEYGMRELMDNTKQDLKSRVKRVIKSCADVENYFRFHQLATPAIKEVFEREFLKSETVLLAELLVATWRLSEESLEHIIEQIQKASEDGI